MYNFAHRGYSELYPENTMEAFVEAYIKGFDGIETDVHMCKDGNLVLIHDETIDRTSDGHGYIKDMTLDELREFNYCYKFKGMFQIPLLSDLLAFIKGKDILLNIEIKTDCIHYEGIEEKIVRMVKDYGVEKQIFYSSFYLPSLLKVKELDNDAYIGYLIEEDYDLKYKELLKYNIKGFHPRYDFLDKKRVGLLKNNGIFISTWTIKSKDDYNKLDKMGVDICISNKFLK